MGLIKSTSFDQAEIIKNILQLHVPQGFVDCDCTYSKGNFYNKTEIEHPMYKYDIKPQTEDTVQASADNLPLENNSINCMMFDPPFLATKGKSLEINNGSNKINKRFGVFPTETELHEFYIKAMQESYRVLKENGIMIFKCQDKVSSQKQYMSHCFIYNEATRLGFYPKDLFILEAKNRLVADWQIKNQQHARKFHSYFWVLQKCNKQIKYTAS